MFLKTYYLIHRNPFNFETKIDAIIHFLNEQKHEEYMRASDKRSWLMAELNLPESYFWNTYLADPEDYISEIDNEYLIDKQLQQADEFDIK
jgi:hypothetical protein